MSCDDPSQQSPQTDASSGRITYCDGRRANNVWLEGADEFGGGGVCMLDTMTRDQVIYVLQRDPKAREDIQTITTDTELKEWAATIPMLPSGNPGDILQKQMNANAASIPFYSLFAGKPPTAR
jgi:hypothetical protein